MKTYSHEDLVDLLNEFAVWYHRLSQKGMLPRTLSGIDANGQQFLLRMDGVTLGHEERHQLIRTILAEEQSICYAYGGLIRQEDGDHLTLITANSDEYVIGSWLVIRDEGIRLEQKDLWEGDNPEEVPGAWFLTDAVSLSEEEQARYRAIWKELADQAVNMQRPEKIRPGKA